MQEHSIEKGFENLSDIIDKMAASDVSLEEAFDLYKTGIEELKYCNSKLENTKKAVMEYQADGSFAVFEGVE